MRTISTRLRLTLWYAGLLTVILVAFGAAVYLVTRQTLYSNLDESIEAQAAAILGSHPFRRGAPSPVGRHFDALGRRPLHPSLWRFRAAVNGAGP